MTWALVRASVVLVLVPVLAALVARPPVPGLPYVVAGLGAVLGFAGRSALFVLFVRRGLVKSTAGARPHGLLLGNLVGALLGAAAALPFALALEGFTRAAIVGGGVAALLPAAALALRATRAERGPRTVSLAVWLLRDTALPAGLLAAVAGAGAVWVRLHAFDVVPPGELARHLGGTTYLYAILLGIGGFLKASAEIKGGLVVTAVPQRSTPGPLLLGAALGTALLLSAPLLPALPFATVLWLKVALGLIGGGGLSLLGALQGARAAAR